VLAITVLGSGIAAIDATVVNIALPAIGREFHTGIAALQWVMTSYILTLAAFLLIGGSLGDRFGRRKVYLIGSDGVEGLGRCAVGIGAGLDDQRDGRAEQDGLGHPGGAVAADVPGHLGAAGGVADQDRVMQAERLDQGGQVVGVGVHVIAGPGLVRTPVAAPVVGDGAVAVGRHVEHLVVPGVGVQRPAVAEHDRLPGAPVLVVDPGAVRGRDHSHQDSPS
jgi:hypothetical protein